MPLCTLVRAAQLCDYPLTSTVVAHIVVYPRGAIRKSLCDVRSEKWY